MTEGQIDTEALPTREQVTVYGARTEDGGIATLTLSNPKADVIEERRRAREGLPPPDSQKAVKLEFQIIPPTNTILSLELPGQGTYTYERLVPSRLNPADRPLLKYPDSVFIRRLRAEDIRRLREEHPNIVQEPLAKYLSGSVRRELGLKNP
jgi:hypothetical protein